MVKSGRCGLGPGLLQRNDILAVILGCRMPLILRPTCIPGEFKLIGPCWVYELMCDNDDNYAAIEWRSGRLEKEKITLM